eukprot:76965_1
MPLCKSLRVIHCMIIEFWIRNECSSDVSLPIDCNRLIVSYAQKPYCAKWSKVYCGKYSQPSYSQKAIDLGTIYEDPSFRMRHYLPLYDTTTINYCLKLNGYRSCNYYGVVSSECNGNYKLFYDMVPTKMRYGVWGQCRDETDWYPAINGECRLKFEFNFENPNHKTITLYIDGKKYTPNEQDYSIDINDGGKENKWYPFVRLFNKGQSVRIVDDDYEANIEQIKTLKGLERLERMRAWGMFDHYPCSEDEIVKGDDESDSDFRM